MRYNHPTLFAANLLAYLEATSLGLADGPEEERQRASRIAATVTQTESRKWRAHRRPSPGRSRSMRRMGLSLSLVVLTALSLAAPADAGVCPGEAPGCGWSRCGMPARPAPALLWGQELKPAETQIPASRDSTNFNEFFAPYGVNHPQFMDVDIKDKYLFTALGWGLQVWDLRTQPANPQRLAVVSGPTAFRQWSPNPEVKRPVRSLAAASSNLITLGGQGVGLLAFNTAVKTAPWLHYQDARFDLFDVATTTSSGVTFGLAAGGPAGLRLYNLTSATNLTRCLDGLDFCPGVYLGRIGTNQAVSVAALGRVVATGAGAARGFELWDLGQPGQPRRILADLSGTPVFGVALWQQGSSLYLGLHTGADVRIYDATCALAGTCSALSLLSSKPVLDFASFEHLLTFSRSGSTPFLYAGSDNYCTGGLQREWLWNVNDPRQPRDVSPLPVGSGSSAQSYWGWYYHGNRTGFNNINPRVAVFDGPYLYRAALSVLDIHRWAPAPVRPTVSFLYSPAPPAPNQAVQFQSTATQSPTSYTWSFSGGIPSFASGPSPTTRWTRPGLKRVTHSACNQAGCSSASVDVGVATYTDVPPLHWAWSYVEAVTVARIVSGCGTTLFCPDPRITRADLAVYLVKAKRGASYVPPAATGIFADVPPTHPAAPWIERLYRDGIVLGCSESPLLFCPTQSVNRAMMAFLLVRTRRSPTYVPPPATGVFADVPRTHWAAPHIEQIYRDGVTGGCGVSPRVYCPDADMSRAEAAVFLARAFHLPIP